MIIIERGPVSPDTPVPFEWGTVVEALDDHVHEVVVLPDNNLGEARTIDLHELLTNSKTTWSRGRPWNNLKFVSDVSSIDNRSLKLLEPFRRGICLIPLSWDQGITLFDDNTFFSYLRGNRSAKVIEQMTANLGGMKMLKQFWSGNLTEWRVFVHKKFNWNHWEMSGPFSSQREAEDVFEKEKQKGIADPPRRLRHGVYENTGQTNTVLLYDGVDLVSEFILVIGQGMPPEERKATN